MNQQLTLKHWAIIAFCLWHMFAVGAYLLPGGYKDSLGLAMAHANRLSQPYVLSLSQWQKWDIFSPDPLRRVTDFRVEVERNGKWEVVKAFTYDTLAWHERAKELKVLGRLEFGWERLVPSYLSSACRKYGVPAGSAVRLASSYRVLPSDLSTLRRLSRTPLPRTENVLGTIQCPA